MARAISVNQLYSKKRKLLAFDGEWLDCFGMPELAGCWFVYGGSGNGKTSFVLQLIKYLTKFARVAYNSMEEGDSESMRLAFMRTGMDECKRRVVLLDNEPIVELKERLKKHKSQKIIVIDSIQYSGMTYVEYKELRNQFRDVLFIIISHAEGKKPADKRAESIRYDASVKIFIEGYVAYITSRYRTGDVKEYVIWKEQSDKFHLKTI
ncbi:MAG: hypothetical protein ACYC6C_13610 [Coriobacteriia bacterium]